ncbi:MAG TPA: hypothetical protein PKD85_03045 [Saprospiraceae bacterium]|mgnify:CR=1 FL=1|nr:hypothetical protein [Saprospiraceae bacterium]
MSDYVDLDSFWRDRSVYPNPCNYELLPSQIATWARAARDTKALPANPNERPMDFVNSVSLICATLPYPRIELFTPTTITVDSITGGNTINTVGNHGLIANDIVMTSTPGFALTNGIRRNVEYHIIAPVTPTSFQISLTSGGVAVALTNGTGLNLVMGAIPLALYATIIGNLDDAIALVSFPRLYVNFHSKVYNDTRLIRTIGAILSDAKFVIGIDKVQFDDTGRPVWIHYKAHGEQVFRFKRDDCVVLQIMTRDGTIIPFFTETDLSIPTNPQRQTLVTFNVTPYLKDATYTNQGFETLSNN